MNASKRGAIVYNSDAWISDPSDLATLCVFYERVYLPHRSDNGFIGYQTDTADAGSRMRVVDVHTEVLYTDAQGVQRETGEDVAEWDERHRVLFAEGTLARLAEPDTVHLPEPGDTAPEDFRQLLPCLGMRLESSSPSSGRAFVFIRADNLTHLLRGDVRLPQVFRSREGSASREVMKALEAKAVFTYLLPRIAELQPEDLLQVRSKVKDTREGFSLHLQALSEQVEARLKGGESIDEITKYARSVVDTKLIPDYREFNRQLMAERSGLWKTVVERVSAVFEIDAAPWTPKFYGELLRALGLTALTAAAERKESLSNRAHAFNFMRQLEGPDSNGV